MEIIGTPQRMVRLRWLCPGEECDGEMIAPARVVTHRCSKCGYEADSSDTHSYPRLVWEDIA